MKYLCDYYNVLLLKSSTNHLQNVEVGLVSYTGELPELLGWPWRCFPSFFSCFDDGKRIILSFGLAIRERKTHPASLHMTWYFFLVCIVAFIATFFSILLYITWYFWIVYIWSWLSVVIGFTWILASMFPKFIDVFLSPYEIPVSITNFVFTSWIWSMFLSLLWKRLLVWRSKTILHLCS